MLSCWVTLGRHIYLSETQLVSEELYDRFSTSEPLSVWRGSTALWNSQAYPPTLQFLKTHRDPGAVLLLPFLVSCINLAVPRFYSLFRLVERYEIPRQEVYVLLIR